jgi:cysteine-rich repeat protein
VVCRLGAALALLACAACGRIGYEGAGGSAGARDAGGGVLDSSTGQSGDDGGVARCGDGVRAADEQCDDGNGAPHDGCESDCTFSCAESSDCDDGAACNGVEACDTATHACTAGVPATDGTECARGTCRAGTCAPPGCGDAVESGEEDCDDGNTISGDGCEADCTFTCSLTSDCDDDNPCNGAATCATASHTCTDGMPPEAGTACERDGNPETPDHCVENDCRLSFCGDGLTDAALDEQCDDHNTVEGDGCEADCTFSCTTDAQCDDGNVCNGTETCVLAPHTCDSGAAAPSGTPCPGGSCQEGVCQPSADAGSSTDAGTDACATCPTDGGTVLGACTTSLDCPGIVIHYCIYPEGVCGAPGRCVRGGSCLEPDTGPACGCDGITYMSPCDAIEMGVSILRDGPC